MGAGQRHLADQRDDRPAVLGQLDRGIAYSESWSYVSPSVGLTEGRPAGSPPCFQRFQGLVERICCRSSHHSAAIAASSRTGSAAPMVRSEPSPAVRLGSGPAPSADPAAELGDEPLLEQPRVLVGGVAVLAVDDVDGDGHCIGRGVLGGDLPPRPSRGSTITSAPTWSASRNFPATLSGVVEHAGHCVSPCARVPCSGHLRVDLPSPSRPEGLCDRFFFVEGSDQAVTVLQPRWSHSSRRCSSSPAA